MPNYAEPFDYLGQAAGGAAGAAGGGFLGRVGDAIGGLLSPLDYPRQALYNAGTALGHVLDGTQDWHDLLRAAPGMLGAGLAGGLMATGVGAPLGILAGSVLGGAAQGVGKAADAKDFDAATPEDLLHRVGVDTSDWGGKLAGMAVGAMTDPLSYAGGLGGAAKGGEAGANFGRELEQQAIARGPRYGGADTLRALAPTLDDSNAIGHMSNILGHPQFDRIANEVMPGSTHLGSGVESIAFQRPDGGVTRVGRPSEMIDGLGVEGGVKFDQAPAPRADVGGVLQATRSVPINERTPLSADMLQALREGQSPNLYDPVRVDHTPLLDVRYGRRPGANPWETLAADREGTQQGTILRDAIQKSDQADFWDAHGGNFGYTPEGKALVLDSGSLEQMPKAPPVPLAADPVAAADQLGQPSRLQNLLLSLLGSDKSIQREIAAGVSPGALAGKGVDMEAARASLEADRLKSYEELMAQSDGSGPRSSGSSAGSSSENVFAQARQPGGDLDSMIGDLADRLGIAKDPATPSPTDRVRALLRQAGQKNQLRRQLEGG